MGYRDHQQEVTATFADRYGEHPAVVARAPGRVNLVGGHVDYNDGIVLPAAIDRWTVVAARPRSDGRLRAHSTHMDESVDARIGDEVDGWAAYVVGTATLLADAVDESVGADLAIDGDVPLGAGLSSSASLEVAIAGALDGAHDLGLGERRIAELCWEAETEVVGVDCGIMDQFTSALAHPDHALRIDCRSREVDSVPFVSEAMGLLVVDTNVSHDLADSGYNDRVRECDEAVAALDEVLDRRVRSLRDVTPADVDAHIDDLTPPLARRARHVTTEIRRAEAAADALARGDVKTLGELVWASHRSLRDDFEVSCAELDVVVDAFHDCDGVYGARMVGGGWGGSVVALVQPGGAEAVTEHVEARYRSAAGIECDVYEFDVAGGLAVETLTSG